MKTIGIFRDDCSELKELKELSQNLEETKNLLKTNQLSAIVLFLKNLSSWHNQEGVKDLINCLNQKNKLNGYGKLIEEFRLLQRHFDQTGFCKNGINRTPYGQMASAETIFLGGLTYNIPNQSVASWIKIRTKSKNGKAVCRTISEQAKKFLQIHIDCMLYLILEINKIIEEMKTEKNQKKKEKEGRYLRQTVV